jgi:hypothetical protein
MRTDSLNQRALLGHDPKPTEFKHYLWDRAGLWLDRFEARKRIVRLCVGLEGTPAFSARSD